MAIGNFSGLAITAQSTAAVSKNRAVGFDNLQITTAGAAVKGITHTAQVANVDFTITIDGTDKWESGAAVANGARLTSDAQGRCVAATAGQFVSARAMSAATAAGQEVLILFTREGNA